MIETLEIQMSHNFVRGCCGCCEFQVLLPQAGPGLRVGGEGRRCSESSLRLFQPKTFGVSQNYYFYLNNLEFLNIIISP